MTSEEASPISLRVNVARLPARGMPVTIEADSRQREALARVHSLLAVDRLDVELTVTAWKRGGVRIAGRVKAAIRQECIATLEPIHEIVDEEIAALFVPEGSKLALPRLSHEGEIVLDAEGDDAPETFSGDEIDVGQLAEEFFALGINPYPRKPGVTVDSGSSVAGEMRGPLFDKLSQLRKKL